MDLSSCVFLQAGVSVGWTLGYMLSLSNMVPAESPGMMKTMPSGAWGVILLFICIALIAVRYFLIIYKNKEQGGMV